MREESTVSMETQVPWCEEMVEIGLGLRALVRAGLHARDILEDSVTGRDLPSGS